MRDLRKYWQEVSTLEKALDAFVWLVSKTGAPTLVQVSAAIAAKLLHAGTHRQATEDELEAHRGQEDRLRRQSFHDDLRRKGIAVVPLSDPKPR